MGRANQKVYGDRSGVAAVSGVPSPLRVGRGDVRGNGGNDNKARGPASALEDIMRRQGVDEAWCALEQMQSQGVTTDKYTVSRMLMKTIGDGRSRLNPSRVYRCIGLVERFIDAQPKDVDEVLFNALLDTCCRLKDPSRLQALMTRMRELNVTPSPVTLGILVKAHGQAGDFQQVLQVWEEMDQQRSQANAVTYGCMIDACVKCGHLEKAAEIFAGMRETGKHKNTILYTTLIKGYGLEKDLTTALELFREMPKEGVPYNTITYNSIIEACIKCGDLTTAEGLLREMCGAQSPLEPDLITFSTLLKGYCHIGELDKALQVVEAIKARNLRCDELVFNTLMDGCVKANDVSVGVGLFEEMVQLGLRPSAITHGILTRLYQRSGSEEDAHNAVAQLYFHHGIERPAAQDRGGKGAGRRWNQRSPGGRNYADKSPMGSPTGSVTSGMGLQRERSESDCWSECGYSNWGGIPALPSPSAPSTPAGSLQASPTHGMAAYGGMMGDGNGAFLPMGAMGNSCVPPLPGTMYPDGSPCSQASFTQMGSFPTSSPHANNCMGGVYGTSHFGFAPMSTQPPQQVLPNAALPPWPFACNGAPQVASAGGYAAGSMPPPPPSYSPSDAMQQMYSAQMMQGQMSRGELEAPIQMPVGGGCASMQQSPFPMPLSPPHDLACANQGQMLQMGQQATMGFFENTQPADVGQQQQFANGGNGHCANQGFFLS